MLFIYSENLLIFYAILTRNNYLSLDFGKKIKNKIRTFEPEIGSKFKNAQAQIQISSSYKVKRVYTMLFFLAEFYRGINLMNNCKPGPACKLAKKRSPICTTIKSPPTRYTYSKTFFGIILDI